MLDELVLDSSVIAAIFFKEEASERAEEVSENHDLTTIDIAVPEVANVAWKRVIFFNEPREITLIALNRCIDFIMNVCKTVASQELLENAFEIAVSDRITVYDALFVAASERENAPLLTLDEKLHKSVNGKRNVKLV